MVGNNFSANIVHCAAGGVGDVYRNGIVTNSLAVKASSKTKAGGCTEARKGEIRLHHLNPIFVRQFGRLQSRCNSG